MNKYFTVTAKFNLTEDVKKIIGMDFDLEKIDSDGKMDFAYRGNSRSTEKSAINGTRQMLIQHHLSGCFKITGAAER